MNLTIKLYRKPLFNAVEVQDIFSDTMLPAKLSSG